MNLCVIGRSSMMPGKSDIQFSPRCLVIHRVEYIVYVRGLEL